MNIRDEDFLREISDENLELVGGNLANYRQGTNTAKQEDTENKEGSSVI